MWTFLPDVRRWFRARFDRYLARTIPRQTKIRLSQKRLFILPTAAGWGYAVAAILIWLLGTNYENNLALALAYFLFALFLVAIIHTFKNLYHLQLRFISAKPVFAGELAEVKIAVAAGSGDRFALQMHWPKSSRVRVNIDKQQEKTTTIFVHAKRRGMYHPPRFTLESNYPVSLWRCWSYLDLDVAILTYPKPIPSNTLPHSITSDQTGRTTATAGGEDFSHLRTYRIGDSLKHISWKHVAQGRGLQTKNYEAHLDNRIWLDWDLLAGMEPETRLSRLTYLALEAEKTSDVYGLRLPGVEVTPDRGKKHLANVLTRLALFDSGEISTLRRGSA